VTKIRILLDEWGIDSPLNYLRVSGCFYCKHLLISLRLWERNG